MWRAKVGIASAILHIALASESDIAPYEKNGKYIQNRKMYVIISLEEMEGKERQGIGQE